MVNRPMFSGSPSPLDESLQRIKAIIQLTVQTSNSYLRTTIYTIAHAWRRIIRQFGSLVYGMNPPLFHFLQLVKVLGPSSHDELQITTFFIMMSLQLHHDELQITTFFIMMSFKSLRSSIMMNFKSLHSSS